MRNEKIKKRQLQLREKLVILVGAVLLGTIAVLSGIAWVNLSNAYEMLAEAEEATFDTKMKTAAENVIGMLTVNDQRFRNGELTEQQAMENALALLRDTRYDDGGAIFGPTPRMAQVSLG